METLSICNVCNNKLIRAQISQTNFDSESFDYFKICEELKEVSMMKSVPNLISYLQQFSQIFLTLYLFFLCEKLFLNISEKGKALTCGACLSAAKPPCAVPRLAARGGTAIAPVP
jgi:hypothetical protein